MNKKYLTVNDAIEVFSLSRTTIYYLRKHNLIKWFTVPIPQSKRFSPERPKKRATKVLILRESLEQYVEQNASQ